MTLRKDSIPALYCTIHSPTGCKPPSYQAGADECIDMAQHKPEQLKSLLRHSASQGKCYRRQPACGWMACKWWFKKGQAAVASLALALTSSSYLCICNL